MVDGAVADAGFLHAAYHLLERLEVLGRIAVELDVRDVACVCKCMVRSFDLDLIEGVDREVYRHVEGVGVVVAVGNTLDNAEALLVDADEAAGQTLSRGSEAGEVELHLVALLIELLSHKADDLQTEPLSFLGFAVMLADQGDKSLGKTDEADGERAVLEHLAHLVVDGELLGVDPNALTHQEGIVAHTLLALYLKALEDLLDAQVEHTVELIEEEVDVLVCEDREPGQVDGGEAQVASAEGDLSCRVVLVADDAGTAAHVGYLGLGTALFIVSEVVRSVDEGVVGEEALSRYAEAELEQIVVRVAGVVVHALFYLEDVYGEDRGLAVAQTLLGSEQDVLDDHTTLGRGIGAVVDGGEGYLCACTAVHGVQVMHDSLHSLEGRAVCLFQSVLLGKALELAGKLLVVGGCEQLQFLLLILGATLYLGDLAGGSLRGSADGVDGLLGVLVVRKELCAAGEVHAVSLVVCLDNAGSHAVVEVRHRLAAVLVVLVRLDRDAGESSVGGDIVGLADEAVTGGEAVLEQLDKVNLAAGGGEGEEVEVVDVDVALAVRLGELGVEDVHLIEFLRALGTVLEHGAHRGVAVDVGVLTLDVVILSGFEGQVFVDLHQLGVHFTDSGTLRAIEDELLRSSGVTVFDQDLLNGVLNVLDGGSVVVLRL